MAKRRNLTDTEKALFKLAGECTCEHFHVRQEGEFKVYTPHSKDCPNGLVILSLNLDEKPKTDTNGRYRKSIHDHQKRMYLS